MATVQGSNPRCLLAHCRQHVETAAAQCCHVAPSHTYPPNRYVRSSSSLCYVAAAHYLELDCGKRESRQEVTRQNVAVAGLHFLAALFAHAAQMDSHAPADPESLATTEAANTSVTGTSWARLPFGCNALARLCTCDAATNLSKACLCTCEHIALLPHTFQASATSPLSQMLLWHTLCDVQPT